MLKDVTIFSEEKIQRWTETRRDIHAHPELRYEEERTSKVVNERLIELGFNTILGLGKTGVVGLLKGKQYRNGAPTIGIRADMDALPIQESNDFLHKSRHDGKMHACGHDGHTATLLAFAEELSENDQFDGQVALIFQPAEEGGAGAKAMIEDGLFEKVPMQAVFALHNWPGLAEGEIAIHQGPVMASSNEFHITVHGKGCHAAMPDLGTDPIIIGSHLVTALQTIVSRNKRPLDSGVVSVTQFHAGRTINVIPETAEIKGTVRTFKPEVLDLIEEKLVNKTKLLCESFGATAEVKFIRSYPATVNNEHLSSWLANTYSNKTSLKISQNLDPTMGAEDFSYMLEKTPGVYFWLGNGDGAHREAGHGLGPCMLHNPSYDFNDRLIAKGVTLWMTLVENYFKDRPLG